ncbi:MAG: DUF4923 family protein [Bacteroidales bacterium]|nr:DUF4923 family protein [Bacteroidales bacterium]
MKKVFAVLALSLAVFAANAQTGAQSILNQLLGQGATKDALTSIIENVVGGAVSKLDLSIEGTWTYSQPEVQFKSDNLLAQAGGAAATTKVENTLKKLYDKIGINKSLSYTFSSDSTFTQTIKIGSSVKTLKGTYTLDKENKVITLQYAALGKIGLGKINAIYANTGTSLALLFDASQMLSFTKKVLAALSSVSGVASISTITALIQNYDGMLLGYKMTK